MRIGMYLLSSTFREESVSDLATEADQSASDANARRVAIAFAEAIDDVVDDAGLGDPDEIVAATTYGMSGVAESIHQLLRAGGPRWLDPESFLYYSAYAPLAVAAVHRRHSTPGVTLMGPDSGMQALEFASARIRSGVSQTVVVSAYDALTPMAHAALDDLGMQVRKGGGQVAALVLSGRRSDGDRAVAAVEVWSGGSNLREVAVRLPVEPVHVINGSSDGDAGTIRDAFPDSSFGILPPTSPSVGPLMAIATLAEGALPAAVVRRSGVSWGTVLVR